MNTLPPGGGITADGKIYIGEIPATITTNQTPIDKFTALHFLFGLGLAKYKFELYQVLFAAVSFELLEDVLKDRYPKMWPYSSKDSKTNSLVDILATVGGYGIGKEIKI